ncbi:MAG: GTP 3',8-cyclase MoaA [Thermoanaerobaculaceae bacterium]
MRSPGNSQAPEAVLRVSLTDRCNLRCRYCMPAHGVPFIPHDQLPTLEVLAQAVDFTVRHLGVTRIKLTGGEPLVRKGAVAFVGMISRLPGVKEVSMTTNGTLLPAFASKLKQAGLARVNVSLDTLDAEDFYELTRGGDVTQVVAGILAARRAGLSPVKLNTVLRASSFTKCVPELVKFAIANQLELRFIELMETGTEAAWAQQEFVSAQEVQAFLQELGQLEPLPTPGSSPARRMRFRGLGGETILGFISPVSHSFCQDCNRLRLDARGHLRRCLMDPSTISITTLLQDGEEKALLAVQPYLEAKKPPVAMVSRLPMVAVGG